MGCLALNTYMAPTSPTWRKWFSMARQWCSAVRVSLRRALLLRARLLPAYLRSRSQSRPESPGWYLSAKRTAPPSSPTVRYENTSWSRRAPSSAKASARVFRETTTSILTQRPARRHVPLESCSRSTRQGPTENTAESGTDEANCWMDTSQAKCPPPLWYQ